MTEQSTPEPLEAIAELGSVEVYSPDVLDGHITRAQLARFVTPVRADRVEVKQKMTYIPAHEVRAELIRTFGPGRWDSQVIEKELIYEEQRPGTSENTKNKMYWFACYRVGVRLRVRDYRGRPIAEFIEYHVEENAAQPLRSEAHAIAITSASSYALRRCAIGLGDNFGLHLYDKGSMEALVKNSLYGAEYLRKVEPLPPAPKEDGDAAEGSMPAEEEKAPVDPAAQAAAASQLTGGFAHPEGRTE